MKTMTRKQLGGTCDKKFHANSFEEITETSKKHGMEMFQKGDEEHLKAMNEMKNLMQKPDAMKEWFEDKKRNLKHYRRIRSIKGNLYLNKKYICSFVQVHTT